MFIYIIIGTVFLATFLFALALMYLVSRRRDPVRARLQELATAAGTAREGSYDLRTSLLHKGVDLFASNAERIATTREWLNKGGYHGQRAVYDYYIIRAGLAVILSVTAGILTTYYLHWAAIRVFLTVGAGILAGFFLPTFWVSRRIVKRRDEIRRAVPNMLDLLVVCVEAGLSFTAALHKLTDEIQTSCAPLAHELRTVTQEILIGKPKAEAFRNLANRTEVDELRSLAVTLIQADRLGTSIAASLRVLADTMRFKRRQRAEEAANKVTVKLVFPLVLLIFPELLIILVGPAMISIFHALKSVGH